MTYYKVLGKDGAPCNGGKGEWNLPLNGKPGEWMPRIEKLVPCKSGYHVCAIEQLLDWLGPHIYEVEIRGDQIAHPHDKPDKIVVQEARLVKRITAWTDRSARLFACDCAEHVLPIYEQEHPKDKRPRDTIATARAYVSGKATKEELAAARAAAWDAAWDAARDAAWDAAWDAARAAARDAAWDAERKWQIEHLQKILDGEIYMEGETYAGMDHDRGGE